MQPEAGQQGSRPRGSAQGAEGCLSQRFRNGSGAAGQTEQSCVQNSSTSSVLGAEQKPCSACHAVNKAAAEAGQAVLVVAQSFSSLSSAAVQAERAHKPGVQCWGQYKRGMSLVLCCAAGSTHWSECGSCSSAVTWYCMHFLVVVCTTHSTVVTVPRQGVSA